MTRGTSRRRLAGIGALFVAATMVLAMPQPALADGHDYATVSGVDLAAPVTVTAEEHPDQYAALRREVVWLINREGDREEPAADELGPQYTLLLFVEGQERHRFHLYPLAAGGPRVFRPADQPGDDAEEAWFLGRLSQPEILLELGVPLTGTPPDGGVAGEDSSTAEAENGPLGFVDEWRDGMLLTIALALAVLAGLASVSLLVRRDR